MNASDDLTTLPDGGCAVPAGLHDREMTLAAIHAGDVDAVVVNRPGEQLQIVTLHSPDHPPLVLIDRINEGTVTLDEAGRIIYSNDRVSELFGMPRSDLVGQPMQRFLAPEHREIFNGMREQARHTNAQSPLTLCTIDGRQIPIYLSLSILRRADGPGLLCGVLSDLSGQARHIKELAYSNSRLAEEIAAREAAEAARRHGQRLEAIGGLAAGVAHDFNNILQSIIASLELVLDEVPATSMAFECTELAINAAMRGASVTNHLLSFARKQILNPQGIPLPAFMADMQKLLGRTIGSQFDVQLCLQSTRSVLADPGQLQTALLNLAINASHAMPQGGILRMWTRDDTRADHPRVVIGMTDQGIGMDPAMVAQAIEPFFTTKGLDGSGLGLSMVHGFVAQSGGELVISSTPGVGTTVELWLPVGAEAAIGVAPKPAATAAAAARILLVDDAMDVLVTAAAFLEKADLSVTRASNGRDALELFAAGARFDALIADYWMPGHNGIELITAVRRFQPGLAALIITGFAGPQVGGYLPEGTLLLRKPFKREALMAAITQVRERVP